MCQISVSTVHNSQRDWQRKKLQFWQVGKGLFVPSEAWGDSLDFNTGRKHSDHMLTRSTMKQQNIDKQLLYFDAFNLGVISLKTKLQFSSTVRIWICTDNTRGSLF